MSSPQRASIHSVSGRKSDLRSNAATTDSSSSRTAASTPVVAKAARSSAVSITYFPREFREKKRRWPPAITMCGPTVLFGMAAMSACPPLASATA